MDFNQNDSMGSADKTKTLQKQKTISTPGFSQKNKFIFQESAADQDEMEESVDLSE